MFCYNIWGTDLKICLLPNKPLQMQYVVRELELNIFFILSKFWTPKAGSISSFIFIKEGNLSCMIGHCKKFVYVRLNIFFQGKMKKFLWQSLSKDYIVNIDKKGQICTTIKNSTRFKLKGYRIH